MNMNANNANAATNILLHNLQNQNNQEDKGLQLRPAELQRAKEIKTAVLKDERICHSELTDFDYVQWALTTVGYSLEVVCEKIYLMQCFRREYNLLDTPQECADLLIKITLGLFPGYFLSFDYIANDQNYAFVTDLSRFNPAAVVSQEDFRVYFGSAFYVWQAGCQNFICMRNGMTIMNECMDVSVNMTCLKENQRVSEKFMHEFFNHYPKNDGEYYFLNSPSIINLTFGLIKQIIPTQEGRQAWHLGYQIPGFEGRKLDTIYNVPNLFYNAGRIIRNISRAMDARYKNRSQFTFDNCKVVTGPI